MIEATVVRTRNARLLLIPEGQPIPERAVEYGEAPDVVVRRAYYEGAGRDRD